MPLFLFLAALIQIIWGLTPSASKVVIEFLPVEGYSAIRYTVSGFIFLAVTLVRHRRLSFETTDLPKLVGLGILAYALDSLGTLYGLKTGGVLNFSLASSLNGIITAAISVLLLRETVGPGFIPAAILSIGGGLLLFWGKADVSTFQIAFLSLLLIWTAYIFEALGFVYSKRFKEKLPLTEYLAILQLSAGAFMWIVCLITNRLPTGILTMPSIAWASLIFVCLVACCLCYFVLYWLLNHVDGHKLAFFDCFHTLAAAAFGIFFFGEAFNAKMIMGGLFLLFAVVLVTMNKKTAAH